MLGQFLAQVCTLAVAALAAAVVPQPIRAPVLAVAASDRGAVALTEDDVRVMDVDGFPVGRLARGSTVAKLPGRRTPRAGQRDGFAAAADVRGDDDFNDPYDPDSEIEDPENILVEDEAPPRRRRAVAGSPASGVVLAAGGSCAWVGRQDGLWRVSLDDGAASRVGLPWTGAVRAVAASADGHVVVAAGDGGWARSADGGLRFDAIPGERGPANRLAVTASGEAFALGRGGLRRLGDPRGVTTPVPDAEDLVSCGAVALLLSRQRVFVLAANPDAAEAPVEQGPLVPANTRHLGCTPDGSTWIAYGPSLWTSADRGDSWTLRDELPTLFAVEAVAATRSALWVGAAAGLAVLPATVPPRTPIVHRLRPPEVLAPEGEPAPRGRWWASALPRLDLGFATARSNTRRDVRAFVLLSFTFDDRHAVRLGRRIDTDRAEAIRRAQARRTLGQSAGGVDALADEERDAVARVLGE